MVIGDKSGVSLVCGPQEVPSMYALICTSMELHMKRGKDVDGLQRTERSVQMAKSTLSQTDA